MDARRNTRRDVVEANLRVDRWLKAATDPLEKRRLLTLRKGLRLMLESVAESSK